MKPLEKKEDRRTAYTKKVICESLLVLLETKNLDHITVKELCLYADVNRATFYRYYTDIFDLFKKMEEEIISWNTLNIFSHETSGIFKDVPIYDQLVLIFIKIQEHYSFYHVFFQSNLESDCLQKVLNNEYLQDIEILKKTQPDYDMVYFSYQFEFCKSGAISAIGKWVLNGCKETPEYMAKTITSLIGCPM